MSAAPVCINRRAWRQFPFLHGVVMALPGLIFLGPTGEAVRIDADGACTELRGSPRIRTSIAADHCAPRRPA